MYYSAIGILAALVLVIVNHDILFPGRDKGAKAHLAYRGFLVSVLVFFVADTFWGVLEEHHLIELLYADTVIYFVGMAISVVLWTRYVDAYLDKRNSVMRRFGYVFLALMAVLLVVNLFQPVMFWIDESCTYHAGVARYVILVIQIVMFLLASILAIFGASKTSGRLRRRYLTICLFGFAMVSAVAAQVAFPLWPFYSMGCLVGTCLLHAFVMEDEKDEHRRALEEHIEFERLQEQELGSARRLAFTDPLTGVKSAHSYVNAVEQIDRRIARGELGEFAVAVFDLNDLKLTNDTKGHEAGDLLLISATKLICDHFKHSPVFRVGGDEFVAILEGADYEDRRVLFERFAQQVEENLRAGSAIVASGMSDFDPVHDNAFNAVFERADAKMYMNKQGLKDAK